MTKRIEVESTLTDRYQTTVPETVRRALKLGKRDKIHYSIHPDGEVLLSRVKPEDAEDPVMGSFLGFLARDIAKHPERIKAINPALALRIKSLVGKVAVNLDEALSEDDE